MLDAAGIGLDQVLVRNVLPVLPEIDDVSNEGYIQVHIPSERYRSGREAVEGGGRSTSDSVHG